MNNVLKLQRGGLITPTVVEYEGKVLATNHLDIESLCNLWRVHFGFYTTEKVDLAMTKKQFSSIRQKTLSSVKSVYELFYERNFIPREFEANEEHTEWGMYRNKELEKLEAENDALRERLKEAVVFPCEVESTVYMIHETDEEDKFNPWIDIGKIVSFSIDVNLWIYVQYNSGLTMWYTKEDFEKEVCLTPEAAEARLAELKDRVVSGNEEEKL